MSLLQSSVPTDSSEILNYTDLELNKQFLLLSVLKTVTLLIFFPEFFDEWKDE